MRSASRTATDSGSAPWAAASTARASPESSPRSVRRGRPSRSPSKSAPGRVATSMATPSLRRRLAANSSASDEDASTHCASSTTTNTEPDPPATASRLRTAAPIAKRSPCASRRASTTSSARACGSGSRPKRSLSPAHSSERPANGRSASDSTPCTDSTRIPADCATAHAQSALLPMPGSPDTTSAPLRSWRALASSSSIRAHSTPRPTRAGPSVRAFGESKVLTDLHHANTRAPDAVPPTRDLPGANRDEQREDGGPA